MNTWLSLAVAALTVLAVAAVPFYTRAVADRARRTVLADVEADLLRLHESVRRNGARTDEPGMRALFAAARMVTERRRPGPYTAATVRRRVRDIANEVMPPGSKPAPRRPGWPSGVNRRDLTP